MPHLQNCIRIVFKVEEEFDKFRLDTWLRHMFHAQRGDNFKEQKSIMGIEEVSRSLIQKWIKAKKITSIDNTQISSHNLIRKGEVYQIEIEAVYQNSSVLKPSFIDFKIIFEDENLALIHKEPGMAVHPGPISIFPKLELDATNEREITVVHGLVAKWPSLQKWDSLKNKASSMNNDNKPYSPVIWPGLVHRLDRDTEGLLLVAKNSLTQKKMMALFKKREINKSYFAWVWGALNPAEGIILGNIKRHPKLRLKMQVTEEQGRAAQTKYETIASKNTPRGRKFSSILLKPITGRTHQIRVHLAYKSCPVVGDRLYSTNKIKGKDFGLLLFAKGLEFIHPFTKKKCSFDLELPQRFIDFEKNCDFF